MFFYFLTLIEQPMSNEINVIVQVVRGDGQVAAAASQLRAAVTRQDEVQAQLLDRTAIQLEPTYLFHQIDKMMRREI